MTVLVQILNDVDRPPAVLESARPSAAWPARRRYEMAYVLRIPGA